MKVWRTTNRPLIEDFDGSEIRHFAKKFLTAYGYYNEKYRSYNQMWSANARNIAVLTEDFCRYKLMLSETVIYAYANMNRVHELHEGKMYNYDVVIANRFDIKTIYEFPYLVLSYMHHVNYDENISREDAIKLILNIRRCSIFQMLDLKTLKKDLLDMGYYGFTTNNTNEVWIFDSRALTNIKKLNLDNLRVCRDICY